MTLLVISPDYASHLLPLATIATRERYPGERVVVATGAATAVIVADFGFEHVDLRLGRGSNPGVIRAEQQPRGEDDVLRGFFEATRRGMVETLTYQAQARRGDLLWEPVSTARRVLEVIEQVRPERVIVDHLAFSATLALRAADIAYLDVVLGHPSALPVGSEVYGSPPAWPRCFEPDSSALAGLDKICREVREEFTADYNGALAQLAPGAVPVADAFAAHGEVVLLNYPERLHDPRRSAMLPPHRFLEASIRAEKVPRDVEDWLAATNAQATPERLPIVYVSFGSFLSARADVLTTVVRALRPLPIRVALATGSSDPAALGPLPEHWLVREFLPQISLLMHAALAISHGGNNSITEALSFGVPLLLLPFSTDQFAGAAAVETAGLGVVLDPNRASARALRSAVEELIHPLLA